MRLTRRLHSARTGKRLSVWVGTTSSASGIQRTGELARSIKGYSSWINSIAFSPDGNRLISGSWDGAIRLWDTAARTQARTLQAGEKEVICVAYSPDALRLPPGAGMAVFISGMPLPGRAGRLGGIRIGFTGAAYSPDGSILATGGWDSAIRLWGCDHGRATAAD